MKSPGDLVANDPDKYRFASHSVDLTAWGHRIMREYNPLWPCFRTLLNPKYLRAILCSRRLSDYLGQSVLLVKEFVNQKFVMYSAKKKEE